MPIVLIAALLLICITAGVVGGMDFAPDVAAIEAFEALRAQAPDLTKLAILITHAGSAFGTIGSGVVVTVLLIRAGRRGSALLLGATVIVERLVIDGMKLMIDRIRPSFDLHPVATHSTSFPSGHAGNTMAIFLAIALIAAPPRYRTRAVIAAVGASLLVGMTRPYLGVHWPSDVIGGWSLGAAVAILAWWIAEWRGLSTTQQ